MAAGARGLPGAFKLKQRELRHTAERGIARVIQPCHLQLLCPGPHWNRIRNEPDRSPLALMNAQGRAGVGLCNLELALFTQERPTLKTPFEISIGQEIRMKHAGDHFSPGCP